jgi:hypothetical protein
VFDRRSANLLLFPLCSNNRAVTAGSRIPPAGPISENVYFCHDKKKPGNVG